MTHDLVLSSRWALPENRRREGLRAAHGQDAPTLCDLLSYHLTLKSRRAGTVSPATLRNYGLATRDFLVFCGPPESPRHALTGLEPETIEGYLIGLHRRGLGLGSVRTYLYGVRALFRALLWAGVLHSDPSQGVKAPHDPTPAHTRKRAIPPGPLKL
ncbi:MAG: tyrosine-type recombinase/integrase, partial [Deinococcus sp.]